MTRTYDAWKCTDPRDAEYDAWRDEQMQKETGGWEVEGFISRLLKRGDNNDERLVLEACSHLRAFSSQDAHLREVIEQQRAKIEQVLETLREVDEYLDDRVDINWEGTGPNKEMSLQTEVRAAIRKAEGR